jgi:hypothetical protein
MLTELTTVKSRLALDALDPTYDALLSSAIAAFSSRFDLETNRTLSRTVNAQFEFPAEDSEVAVPCFPIESVTRFERTISETEGWFEQAEVEYLIRRGCLISLATSFAKVRAANWSSPPELVRVTYTGGYLLPGSAAVPAATPLPADLSQAVVEQVAFWFQTRNELGIVRQWPRGGDYKQLVDSDLLPSVRETLGKYKRFTL